MALPLLLFNVYEIQCWRLEWWCSVCKDETSIDSWVLFCRPVCGLKKSVDLSCVLFQQRPLPLLHCVGLSLQPKQSPCYAGRILLKQRFPNCGSRPKSGLRSSVKWVAKVFLEIFIFCHLFVNWIKIPSTSYHCYRIWVYQVKFPV